MRYLVTGASGLLGNNVVRHLLDGEAHDAQVRALVRSTSDPRPLSGLAVQRCEGDVTDRRSIEQAMAGVGAIIHCAGHVHLGWKGLAEHRRVNVEGTRNIASVARQAGARLVYVSSVNALGLGRIDAPADEESALEGIEQVPYVISKREAEQAVREEMGRGLFATIVYPGTIFGPWDWKPSSGRMLIEFNRFPVWAPVGAGSMCDVRDVAAGIIAAASRGASGRRYILAGHNMWYWDLFREIAKLAAQRGPWLPMGPVFRAIASPLFDLRTWLRGTEDGINSATLALSRQQHCFSSARAARELGYSLRPLSETLGDAWNWLEQYGYIGPAAERAPKTEISPFETVARTTDK
jgi:dihydroflavonol-4-reductase